MNKKTIIISVIILVVIIIVAALSLNLGKNNQVPPLSDPENPNIAKANSFKEIILNYPDFKNATVETNETNDQIIIGGLYSVSIKNDYYLMTIKDKSQEKTYCQIFDAIEMNLGKNYQESIDTCEKTLQGGIFTKGIYAEIYDSYKTLRVDAVEAAELYKISSSHTERELISIEEENYDINIGEYTFSSIGTGYSKEIKMFSVCGNVIGNNSNAVADFNVTIYDEYKNTLGTQPLNYKNPNKQYITFCVNYTLETENAKYFSIERAN